MYVNSSGHLQGNGVLTKKTMNEMKTSLSLNLKKSISDIPNDKINLNDMTQY